MIGLLGRKRGMSAIYDAEGRYTPVTILALGPCPVVGVKTRQKDRYDALQLAYEPLRPKLASRPRQGQFRLAGLEPHRVVREIRGMSGDFQPGSVLTVELFQPGDVVNVVGTSKGRGFAGVIKRHGFSRPNQSHGTHESFRGPGSIGSHSFPARTWPGQKMAGRMGGRRVTVKNLIVLGVDGERGLVMLKGAVPGANGGIVTVYKPGQRQAG